MKKEMNKKGQVTIFIILAIVVVGLVLLVYSFYPQIKSAFVTQSKSPNAFMESCLEEDLGVLIEKISLQGGKMNPQLTYMYKGNNIEYLCYTNEFYKLCTIQEPMLKETIELEIKNGINNKVTQCLADLEKSYSSQGYQVSSTKGEVSIELLPKRVILSSDTKLILKKGETTETYEKISAVLNNNLYELVSIAISILNFETVFGDSEVTAYMDAYRDLKVEKLRQSDGTKIYILTDLNNEKLFQFATRSLAWPPGYSNE